MDFNLKFPPIKYKKPQENNLADYLQQEMLPKEYLFFPLNNNNRELLVNTSKAYNSFHPKVYGTRKVHIAQ